MKSITLAPAVRLDDLKGWSELGQLEKQLVREETQNLADALYNESQSRLIIGEHLIKLRKVLLPKHMFLIHLSLLFKMSRATAYRYIKEYEEAKKKLPKPVLEMAKRKGIKAIHIKRVEHHPPAPKTKDPVKIEKYIDSLKSATSHPEVIHTSDTLLKECVNFVSSRFDKLPHNGKTRTAWVRSLIGMLMTKFGMGTEQPFGPMAIPDNFRSTRGRPKQVA